jgi:O-antigen ligase
MLWFLYVLYLIISCIWSGKQSESFSAATGMFFIFFISFLLAQNRALTAKQVENTQTVAMIVSISVICLTLFSSEFAGYGQRVQIVIFGKVGIDENETCSYFFLGIAVAIERLFRKGKWYWKLLYIMVPAISLYSALLLGSRGGMIACLSVMTISVIGQLRRSWKYSALLMISAVLLVVLFEGVILPKLPANLIERFTVEGMSTSARFTIWMDYYSSFMNNPFRMLFGWGAMGSYGISYTNVLHNMFFQVLTDGGIIGFVIYISYILSLFKDSRRSGNSITAAFIGCQVALLSLSTYANMKMIWTIYLLCIVFGNNLTINSIECNSSTKNHQPSALSESTAKREAMK